MAPWVQRLPENHMLIAKISQGLCILVAWAHFILDMRVLVRWHSSDGRTQDIPFGDANEMLFIEYYEEEIAASITLLSRTPENGAKEIMLKVEGDSDSEELRADPHMTTNGYGVAAFDMAVQYRPGSRNQLLGEFTSLAFAFSLLISKHISIDTGYSSPEGEPSLDSKESTRIQKSWRQRPQIYAEISEQRIEEAINVLFHENHWSSEQVASWQTLYLGRNLQSLKLPNSIRGLLGGDVQEQWYNFTRWATELSQLALALAHSQERADIYELLPLGLFRGQHRTYFGNIMNLGSILAAWDGYEPIQVSGDVWFQTIARIMVGTSGGDDVDSASVVSERGWSIFYNTIGLSDPSLIG